MVSFAGSYVADQMAEEFPRRRPNPKKADPGLFVDPSRRAHNELAWRRELGNLMELFMCSFAECEDAF